MVVSLTCEHVDEGPVLLGVRLGHHLRDHGEEHGYTGLGLHQLLLLMQMGIAANEKEGEGPSVYCKEQ